MLVRRVLPLARQVLTPMIAKNTLQISQRLLVPNIFKRSYSESNALTLISAVKTRDREAINQIAVANPRVIIEQTNNDNTALHEAAKNGDVAMIDLLSKSFSKHFNVNHKCHCYLQRTPLHYAVEGGHYDASSRLISELHADPNITDEKGFTCMDYAVRSLLANQDVGGKIYQNQEKILELLASHGGKTNKLTQQAQALMNGMKADRFFNNYRQTVRPNIVESQEKFLKDLFERKSLTPGK